MFAMIDNYDVQETRRAVREETLEKAIRGMKRKNMTDDDIADALSLPLDKVRNVLIFHPENATP